MAYADSPDGPWKHIGKQIFPFGKKGEWDQDQAQDPHPIVYKGKIYMYYKAAYNKWPDKRDKYAVAHGLAIADNPFGPYEKHTLNPVMNSETVIQTVSILNKPDYLKSYFRINF